MTTSRHGIPTMLMRGGSSKGLFLLADDLPSDPAARDDLLLRLMGSPDERQIDGLGGSHPLTSKVAVVAARDRGEAGDSADLDYLFLQVAVDQAQVSDRQNCGNMLAAVGPFALERGLVPAPDPGAEEVELRIRMINTGGVAVATVPVLDGRPRYGGSTAISGVPTTAAPIRLDFDGVAGSSCGALLPTGNPIDVIAGSDGFDDTEVTLIDNGMPVVVIDGASLGVAGTESPAELEVDQGLRARLEAIRLAAGPLMNLGDVADATVPKLTMVSSPSGAGVLSTRTFIPHRCHEAIGVLGAVSVATAALLPGTTANRVMTSQGDGLEPGVDGSPGRATGASRSVLLEHPTGTFEAVIELGYDGTGPVARRSGIIRTARKLMDGMAFPGPPRP